MFPGTRLDPSFAIRPPGFAFFRNGPASEDAVLVQGTTASWTGAGWGKLHTSELAVHYPAPLPGELPLVFHCGFLAIANALDQALAAEPPRSLSVRDYWEWWNADGESDDSGKLLLLRSESEETGEGGEGGAAWLHVFLDDHIEHDHSHIVDTRLAADGSRLPFDKMLGRHIFRAEPFDAITDPDYFISMVARIIDRS
jgi:hypothetical protein